MSHYNVAVFKCCPITRTGTVVVEYNTRLDGTGRRKKETRPEHRRVFIAIIVHEEFLTCAAGRLSKTGHFLLGRDIHTRYYEMSTVPYLNDLPTYAPLRLIFFSRVGYFRPSGMCSRLIFIIFLLFLFLFFFFHFDRHNIIDTCTLHRRTD